MLFIFVVGLLIIFIIANSIIGMIIGSCFDTGYNRSGILTDDINSTIGLIIGFVFSFVAAVIFVSIEYPLA